MKRWMGCLLWCCLVLLITTVVQADIPSPFGNRRPRPVPPPPVNGGAVDNSREAGQGVPLIIVVNPDPNATLSRVEIPQSLLGANGPGTEKNSSLDRSCGCAR